MRCYHLNNFYLSGIHSGIQSAHAQHELALKYLVRGCNDQMPAALDGYKEWMAEHKTIVVLNAGMQSNLLEWHGFLASPLNQNYAWSGFFESNEALNGAMTNIALVLPEHMYAYSTHIVKRLSAGNESSAPEQIGNELFTFSLIDSCGAMALLRHADGKEFKYSAYDLELIRRLQACRLM